MALITVGSINDFSVVPTAPALLATPSLAEIDTFGVLNKKAPKAPLDAFDYAVSSGRRGLTLQSLRLTRGFAKHLPLVFRPTNEIYFVAWTWDMKAMEYYPGEKADPKTCLIGLKSGQVREFMGEGALL